jgi:hypothetical protein
MYEYSTKRQLSGMGWSDISGWRNLLNPGGYCPESNKDRRVCATNDASDLAMMRDAGCTRVAYLNSDNVVDPCTTSSGNQGSVWCCPRNIQAAAGRAATRTSTTIDNVATTTSGNETVARPIINSDLPSTDALIPHQSKMPAPEQTSIAPFAGGLLKAGSITWKAFAVVGCGVFVYFGYNYLVSKGRI